MAAQVSSGDRLAFTLVLAALLHAVILLGVGFTMPRVPAVQVMEVTLVQHRSEARPRHADYLAQADQQGSGSLRQAMLQSTTEQAVFHTATIQTTMAPAHAQEAIDARRIVHGRGDQALLQGRRGAETASRDTPGSDASAAQIASLEARLAERRQAYAKRPRIRSVSTVSTRYDRDALYIDAFRRKVEMVGNEDYPAAARARHLQGAVRLLVALQRDGRVDHIVLLHRSGSALLDAAAERSVWRAAPFLPFPPAIRRDTDILQIIRTWKYSDHLSSSGE